MDMATYQIKNKKANPVYGTSDRGTSDPTNKKPRPLLGDQGFLLEPLG
jgi:hypothetical protein